jgi:hypothetical protein
MVLKETSRVAVPPNFLLWLFSNLRKGYKLQVFEKKLSRKTGHKKGKDVRENFSTAG